MAKIVSIASKYYKATASPLSKLMIVSLLSAYQAQQMGYISSATVAGSLPLLIRRGLVTGEVLSFNKKYFIEWTVTPEAIRLLRVLGYQLDVA